jgi:hypothetical protein
VTDSTPTEADRDRQYDERTQLAVLLDETETFCRRFLAALDDAHFVVLTLFVAHTHAIDAADSSPPLHVTSAEPSSGKTRVLEVLELLVAKPAPMIDPTAAALFRGLDTGQFTTVLLDEADNFLAGGAADSDGKRAVLALLNGGYRRGVRVPRVRDRSSTIDLFDVFGPKVIAGLARLPDTLASRSLRIVMRRRRQDEVVERLRRKRVAPEAEGLHDRYVDWATDEIVAVLVRSDPLLPDQLSDRQQDACEPLIAIADLAGSLWPERVRAALIQLVDDSRKQIGDSLGSQLLDDIRQAFLHQGPVLGTSTLLEHLNGLDDRPWGGWKDGQGLKARSLATQLKRFAIRPKDVHLGAGGDRRSVKGYEKADFADAFARYLPPLNEPDSASTPSAPVGMASAIAPPDEPRRPRDTAPAYAGQIPLGDANGAPGAYADPNDRVTGAPAPRPTSLGYCPRCEGLHHPTHTSHGVSWCGCGAVLLDVEHPGSEAR